MSMIEFILMIMLSQIWGQMAWPVAVGDLKDLIEFVLLLIATRLEVLAIRKYFDVSYWLFVMEFIKKYAKVDGSEDDDDQMSAGGDEVNCLDVEFIDDKTNKEQSLTDYRLVNVTRDLQEALQNQSMSADLGECSDPENFVSEHVAEIEYEFDRFVGFEKKIINLDRSWKYLSKTQKTPFILKFSMQLVMPYSKKKKILSFVKMKIYLLKILGETFLMSSKKRRRVCASA